MTLVVYKLYSTHVLPALYVLPQVRMGKGKGTLDYWAAPIRAGQILFEFDRCSKATAMQAVQAIKPKMPIKVDFVEWN
jgi:large subunit ribosomal protein L16